MMSRLAQRRKNKLDRPPKNKISYKKFLKYSFIAVFFILVFWLMYSSPKLLKINKISCISQFGPCNGQVEQEILTLQNNNYLAVKSGLKKMLEKNLYVESFKYNFELPQTIKVEIVERKPQVAIVRQKDTQSLFLMDSHGFVVSQVTFTPLPILIAVQDIDFKLGDSLPQSVVFASKILRQLSNVYNIKLATLESDGVVVDNLSGKTVVFPLSGDLEELLGALNLILSRLNTEQNISKIDLRFKNPILN